LEVIADRWEDGSLQAAIAAVATQAADVFDCATVDVGFGHLPQMKDFVAATAGAVARSRTDK